MKNFLIKLISVFLSILVLLFLILSNSYKIDTTYIDNKLNNKIENIIKNDHPAYFSYTFIEDDLSDIYNNKVTLNNHSFTINKKLNSSDITTTKDGLQINQSLILSTVAIPDFMNIALTIQGTSTSDELTITYDDEVILYTNLTNKLETYQINKDNLKNGKELVIDINSNEFVIKDLVINSYTYTKEEATTIFMDQMIINSSLIYTNPDDAGVDSIDMYNEYVEDELASLKEGIKITTLFKMVKIDFEYNKSVFESSAGLPFNERLKNLWETRYCPFIGLLVFVLLLGIFGSLAYIVVRYIIDLILKQDSKFLIPSIIMLISIALLLNLSTFTSVNFLDKGHNIATTYKLLLFETSKETLNLIISAFLVLGIYLLNVLPTLITSIKQKQNKKYVITNVVITAVSLFFIFIGIIIR